MVKNPLNFLSLAISLMIFLTLSYCKKDAIIDRSLKDKVKYPLRSYPEVSLIAISGAANKQNIDGILEFVDQGEFEQVIECLQFNDQNSEENANEEKDFKLVLGSPALDEFEQSLKFYSLRKKIENETKELLWNRTLTEENDPDNHFIPDDYLRTVLNPYLEIKIGQVIHKFINKYIGVEIMDGSIETLKRIRSMNATIGNDEEPTEEFEKALLEAGNVNLHKSNLAWETGGSSQNCYSNFTINGSGLAITVADNSTGNYDQLAWDFGDGSATISGSPSTIGNYTHTYPVGGNYTICLTVRNQDVIDCDHTRCKSHSVIPADCFADFNVEQPDPTKLEVTFTGNSNASTGATIPDNDYEWLFGAGSNPNIATGIGPHTVTYSSKGPKTVKLTIQDTGGCTDETELEIEVVDECCDANDRGKEKLVTRGNRRIKAKLWQTNFWFYHSVGGKTKYQRRKKFLGIWYWGDENADKIGLYLSGFVYIRNADGVKCTVPVPFTHATTFAEATVENEVKYAYPPAVKFWTRQKSLVSTHSVTDNGVTYETTLSITTDCD